MKDTQPEEDKILIFLPINREIMKLRLPFKGMIQNNNNSPTMKLSGREINLQNQNDHLLFNTE